MRTRCWSVGLGSLLLAACGALHASERMADAASASARDAAPVGAADGSLVETPGDAAAEVAHDAGALADAHPGIDSGGAVDAASAVADAGPDAALRADAQVAPREAGVVACGLEAGMGDASCDAILCSADSGTFVSLHREEGWYVGALDWNAAVCARSLGWPSSSSSDRRDILFAVSPRDIRELSDGAPLFVGYGNPSSLPDQRIAACKLGVQTPLTACPVPLYPPAHQSLVGCRGPNDPNCGSCSVPGPGGQAGYRTTSSGSDWYNIGAVTEPETCAEPCRACASCTYRDEQELKALPARPECEPCPDNAGIDPCFGAGSCECWCFQNKRLTAACPTLAP